MKQVSLTELKNDFSSLIDLVRRGKESLVVSIRGIPVVKIISMTETGEKQNDQAILGNLERAGHLIRASKPMSYLDIENLTVHPKHRIDVLSALLAEREEGR